MKRLFALTLMISLVGAVQAVGAEKRAWAFCPMTHVMGHGRAASLDLAVGKAIKDCKAKGGYPDCCSKFFGEDKA